MGCMYWVKASPNFEFNGWVETLKLSSGRKNHMVAWSLVDSNQLGCWVLSFLGTSSTLTQSWFVSIVSVMGTVIWEKPARRSIVFYNESELGISYTCKLSQTYTNVSFRNIERIYHIWALLGCNEHSVCPLLCLAFQFQFLLP